MGYSSFDNKGFVYSYVQTGDFIISKYETTIHSFLGGKFEIKFNGKSKFYKYDWSRYGFGKELSQIDVTSCLKGNKITVLLFHIENRNSKKVYQVWFFLIILDFKFILIKFMGPVACIIIKIELCIL